MPVPQEPSITSASPGAAATAAPEVTAAPVRATLLWRDPLVVLFACTTFTSAFLLFLVQPLVGRLVLPILGGTAAIWNTCMLFFQCMLLLGYLYAHVLPERIGVRRHAVLHLVLIIASMAFLPLGIAAWQPPASGNPAGWLLVLLTISVGAPFLLISATAPLVQSWFSRTGHRDSRDPYFLYSASNFGSFVALLAYPVLVEPALRLTQQRLAWSAGYILLAALLAVSARRLARTREAPSRSGETDHEAAPGWRSVAHWLVLAFVPSSLLLGLTTHLTTDIAPVPLLWVVPLALYLLTFVLTFARRPPLPHRAMLQAQLPLIGLLIAYLFWDAKWSHPSAIVLYLVVFFVTAMVCHGELARTRPAARHLTSFYLWMSLGGALGGAFNGLVAPMIFDSLVEFPAMLAAACLIRPSISGGVFRRGLLTLAVLTATVGLLYLVSRPLLSGGAETNLSLVVCALLLTASALVLWLSLQRNVALLAVGAAAFLAGGAWLERTQHRTILTERNFYGTREVRVMRGGALHAFLHGTTIHGMQRTEREPSREPLSYFGTAGPLGDVFRAHPARAGRRVGVVGLGIGTMAAYAEAGEAWTFFEIDPAVERLARDPQLFTYLDNSTANISVIIGDGRRTIAATPDGGFDIIILDAFSSDALPTHLLTREAMELYFRKLAPGGVLVFHLSNRYLAIVPTIAATARALGATARTRRVPHSPELFAEGLFGSEWAVVARSSQDLGALADDGRWSLPVPRGRPWTDDYSNVLFTLRALQ